MAEVTELPATMNLKSYVRLNPYADDEKGGEEHYEEEKSRAPLIVCSVLGMLGVGAWWTWCRS